jgi:hypothetical protein
MLCSCGIDQTCLWHLMPNGEWVAICDWCANEFFGVTVEYNSEGMRIGREDMGGKMSREKGARGEREVYKILQPIVAECYTSRGLAPPLMQRNNNQSRAGGYDIVGLDWIAIEVKRREELAINTWWKQTLAQCKDNQEPVLFYRQNNQPWRVIMLVDVHPEHLTCRATLELENFLQYFRVRVMEELNTVE